MDSVFRPVPTQDSETTNLTEVGRPGWSGDQPITSL
jgi:hypothetical protein